MSNELEFMSRAVASGKMNRRDFLGRATALGVTALAAEGLLTRAARAEGPVKGGLLRAGMTTGASTDTLDPALAANAVQNNFNKLWGEYLVRRNHDGSLEYRIAEEIVPSNRGQTWTMKIRDGVEFHNGKTVTPEDVVATLERHHDKNSKSGALGLLQGIESIKATGKEVVLTLKEPNADLPYAMVADHLVIQPNGGKDHPDAGISAGAYTVSENQPGVRLAGQRFKNFWQSDVLGHADQVEIIVINDSTARTAALQNGMVNMINRVEPKIVDFLKRVSGIQIQTASGAGHYYFNMFCNTPPFDNNDLRMALKLATDRDEVLDKILRGYGKIGNDFPINSSYPLFPADIEQRMFDPEKAAAFYKKSGHSGAIELRTSEVAFPGAVDAAQLYQQSCAKAGIKIEVIREPGDGYWSTVWNKKPFSLSYWLGRATQDQMYSLAYLSTADWNDTRFLRPDFDKMIFAARGELDETKRKQMYHDIAVVVRDEGGLICPVFADFVDATGPTVFGYKAHPAGDLMNGYALAECWTTN
ncbi:ABC transporter substrate-binding protein [Mesorhizobium sp. M1340]|uniref:ABC transporter substrate-binding protein n=1 Tax=Mesorhizobium sp. M1340 TaxID=2957087 RepID=UPI0033389C1B